MVKMKKIFLTRENVSKLILMLFGLTLFPGFIHFMGKTFAPAPENVLDFYVYFYHSLLDMGQDGIIVWLIACGPYICYELFVLMKGIFMKSKPLHLTVNRNN
jgi:hypothetical protein